MTRLMQLAVLGAVAALAWPTVLLAQPFPSEVVSFNDEPRDDAGDLGSREMFRDPAWSGSSDMYVVPNDDGYNWNAAFRSSALPTEGAGAMQVFFTWVNPADPEAWVRLSTFNAPIRPNPALHTQGKVRFKITNRSGLFFGQVGICIGVRETGVVAPQLYDGGTDGDIEWIGVDNTNLSVIIDTGTDGIQSTVANDDVLISTNGTEGLIEAINAGPDGVLDSTPIGNDAAAYGFFMATNGTRTPIPAITLPPSSSAVSLEFDLLNGTVKLNSGTPVGGISGMTGDGVLNPANDRGTLEHIAFVNVPADSWADMDLAIDELQFEAPVPDPILPPSVMAPIIALDTSVTVTDLAATVDQVVLYKNGLPLLTEDVTSNDDVVFTIDPAVTDDCYSATQRDSITSQVSSLSEDVCVLPEASPYTFSVLIDELGAGGGEYQWEWAGVTEASGWTSQGQFIFPDDAQWQVVDVPLNDPMQIKAGPGGNGVLEESPTGNYMMDTIWFNIAPGANSNGMGPHEVFIDAVQAIDSNGLVDETILDMEDGVTRLTATRFQSTTTLTSAALSQAAIYDGAYSHRLVWTYPSPSNEYLGILERIGYTADTSKEFSDNTAIIRFHMLCRGQAQNPGVPLPEVVGPIVAGNQDVVQVLTDVDATELQLYINGDAEGSPITLTGTVTDISGLTLEPGDSISATQVVGTNGTSDYAYPKVVSGSPFAPVVVDPIAPGATGVTVNGLYTTPHATTSQVDVYVNDVWAGSAAGGDPSVVVGVAQLAQDDVVKATQTVNAEVSAYSNEVVVDFPAPVFYIAPAANAATVRVMDLYPGATEVTVATTNGLKVFSGAPVSGETYADVPVSGLAVGDVLVATQTAAGLVSPESQMEVVTVGTASVIIDDDFESYADQAALLTAWPKSPSHTLSVELSQERDATDPTGLQSVKGYVDSTANQQTHTAIAPSATNPLVLNVNIYDSVGAGYPTSHWVELNENADGSYAHMIHLGIASTSFSAALDDDYYGIRVLAPGPNWAALNEFDAPMRTVGWHNLTVVHKGEFLDAYVDGKLAKKNITCTNGSSQTLQMVQIGAGYAASYVKELGFYDDILFESGPVHFQPPRTQPPAPPVVVSPIVKGDETVTLKNVDWDAADPVTEVAVYDSSLTEIGSYTLTAADTNGVVDVPLTRALIARELITATQTNIIGESEQSAALEVGVGNGDILISLGVLDGSTTQIEWIGADTSTNGAPQGKPISPSNGWQTIIFDPTSDSITGFTGNGTIDYADGFLEHLAVAVDAESADRSSGPYTLYVDNVVNVGAGAGGSDVVITDFEGYAYGEEVLFQEPTFSGSTYPADLSYPPSASGVVTFHPAGGEGDAVLRWFWKDTTNERWVRLTTASADNIARPAIDLTKPIRMDILLIETPTVKGDMNGDCALGTDDLEDFEACLLGPAVLMDLETCLYADFNDDDVVDLVDFAVFQDNFSNGFAIDGCIVP